MTKTLDLYTLGQQHIDRTQRARDEKCREKDQARQRRVLSTIEQARATYPPELAEALGIDWDNHTWDKSTAQWVDVYIRGETHIGEIPTNVKLIRRSGEAHTRTILRFYAHEDDHPTVTASRSWADDVDDWQAQVAALVAEYVAAYEKWEKAFTAQRDTACRIIGLAQYWTEQENAHDERCKAWAQRWTEELWQPWTAWRIDYCPVGAGEINITVEDKSLLGSVEDALVRSAVTIDGAPGNIRYFPQYNVVDRHGDITRMALGAFFDATRLDYNQPPDINLIAPYHRHYGGGRWTVNVPPTVADEPDPPPKRLEPAWNQYVYHQLPEDLADNLMDLGRYENLTPEWLATATPEQLIGRIGQYL